jgi:hypothetical protein
MHHFKKCSMDKPMAYLWSGGCVALGSVALATSFALGSPSSAQAQAAYGSYIGAGPSFGLSGGNNNQSETSGSFAVRYKLLRAPLSIRTQVLVGGTGTAVVPTLSYDYPLDWQTDLYIGAGASVVRGGNTPIGNKSSFVIQPGVDYVMPYSRWVLYGNAIISFDGYENNGGAGFSIQGGAGLRF